MTMQTESIMVGKEDAAKLCGVGRTLCNELVGSGKTPAPLRLGRRVLWMRDELEKWCQAGCPSREHWNVMKNNDDAS